MSKQDTLVKELYALIESAGNAPAEDGGGITIPEAAAALGVDYQEVVFTKGLLVDRLAETGSAVTVIGRTGSERRDNKMTFILDGGVLDNEKSRPYFIIKLKVIERLLRRIVGMLDPYTQGDKRTAATKQAVRLQRYGRIALDEVVEARDELTA